ncbi:MAG: immunoglobulin domain-containing protein [Chitinophagales bacterium]|nr:immunoglobulin domain-containing protein [Chitinophagales bacterium]
MKRNLPIVLFFFISFFHFKVAFAQEVNVEVQVIAVQRDSYSDCFGCGSPDPTWLISGNTNGSSGIKILTNRQYHNDNSANPNPWNVSAAQIISHTNTDASTITLSLEAFEDNCTCVPLFGCGSSSDYRYESSGCFVGDSKRCINSTAVNFMNDPACTWNEYWTTCGSFSYKVRVYWSWVDAPVVTGPSPVNYALCTGGSAPLSVSVNSRAGQSVGRFYQWQYSTNTDCNTPGTWTNVTATYNSSTPGTGYTTASYTPPQIRGTRLYRAAVTSNCTAVFNSQTTYSNCVRVTYNPMGSPGDLPPPILAGICNQTVLPGSVHTLTTLQPPSPGAVANLISPFYSWAASGGTASGSGASFTWTAPTTQGTYNISVTYKSSCGDFSPSTSCAVTVGSPPCGDYLYVSSTGTDLNNFECSPGNPCRTVSYAINNVLGSRRYIRVSTGTFNEPNIVNMVTGLTIEGKYLVSGGVWSKTNSSTAITTLNFASTGSLELSTVLGNNALCHRVGVKSISDNNWNLIDLNITTQNVPVGQRSGDGRGCSNYALLIDNSSGYNVIRCNIISGNASTGGVGTIGAAGHIGANGLNGGTGGSRDILFGIISSDCNSTANIPGGTGGSGNANVWGGNSGFGGGTGGATCGRSCGSAGNQGLPNPPCVNGGIGTQGGCGGAGTSTGSNCSRGDGSSGQPGAGYDRLIANAAYLTGSGINGGTASASHTTGSYFTPSGQGGQGGHGKSGGGGGGGGASRGENSCSICFCLGNSGNGGSGGGQGAGGGQGGQGGMGGGGSFTIYRTNSTTGTLSNVYLTTAGTCTTGPCAVAAGGAGGAGGDGGPGGSGGAVQDACHGNRGKSGAGGAGGNGAKGGTGQTGALGVSAFVMTDGTASNPSLGAPFTSSPPLTLYSFNQDYCRNSEIQIETQGGVTWAFPGLNIVTDKRDTPAGTASKSCTLTSCNTLGAPISVYTTAANSSYDVTVGGTFYDDALKIGSQLRTLPSINAPSTICDQGTLTLVATGSWGTVQEHDWRIYPGDNLSATVFTSSLASPTTPSLTCASYPCDLTIRYRQREQCCGWSIPVFSKVTIIAPFTRGEVDNTGKAICYNTQANTGIALTTLAGGSGGINYQWYYKAGIDCPVSGSISGWTAIGSNSPSSTSLSSVQVNGLGALTASVTFACWVAPTATVPVCGTADWANNCFVVSVLPDFDAGAVQGLDENFCGGGNPSPVTFSPTPQGSGFTYQWYYNAGDKSNPTASFPTVDPGCPTGTSSSVSGWTAISGATGATYDPPSVNVRVDSSYGVTDALYIGYAAFITPVAVGNLPACGTAQWADSCRVVKETDGNFYPNNLQPNLSLIDRSTNIWTANVCNGFNNGCTSNCFKLTVSPTSGGGPVDVYRVTWQTSTDFSSWTTLQIDSPVTGQKDYIVTSSFTVPTYFRALLLPVDPPCGVEQLTNNYVLVEVLDEFDAGEITGDVSATQCYGYNPPPLTANPTGLFPDGYLGYHNSIYTDFKWESSADGGATWDIVSPYPVNAVLGAVTITSEAVDTIAVTSGGSGYTTPPSVIITDNSTASGAAATVTAVNDTGGITGTNVSPGGTGYTSSGTTVSFTDNTIGSGATATLTVSGGVITAINLTAGGSGYTSSGTIAIISPESFNTPTTTATATATVSAGAVTGDTITNGGAGYTTLLGGPTIQITDTTTGHGATGTATVSAGAVTGITITNAGTGYTTAATIAFSDSLAGTGATATANVSGGAVTSITVTNGGVGYTSGTTVILGSENHSYNKTYNHPDDLTDTTWFRYWVRPTGVSSLDCFGNPTTNDDLVADTIKYDILPVVIPGAITGFTPAAKPQCLNFNPDPLSISPTGALGAYNYQWFTSTDNVNWTPVPLVNSPVYDPGPLTETTYFKVAVDPIGSPDCDIFETTVLEIEIGQSTPAFAGDDADVCSDSYVFSANIPESPGVGTWTLDAGNGTPDDENDANSTVNGLWGSIPTATTVNTFMWEIVTTLCVTTSDFVTITSDRDPDDPNAGVDLYVCDTNAVQLNGNTIAVGAGTWTRLSGSGDIVDPSNPDTWVINLTSGLSQFVWTTSNGVCVDKLDAVNVFTSITPYMTWNGSASTDWNDPVNWGCGNIPGINTIAIIPLVLNFPEIRTRNVGICNSIEVEQQSRLNVMPTAKLGVNKRFVWANAGDDVTLCSNDSTPFIIGNQVVLEQELFADYQWTWTPSGDNIVYTDSVLTPDTIDVLLSIITNKDTTLTYGADTFAIRIRGATITTHPGPNTVVVVNTDTAYVFKDSIYNIITYTDSIVTPAVFVDTSTDSEPVITLHNTSASAITFVLTVTNTTDITDVDVDTMVIYVNRAPVANAGPDHIFCVGSVQLGVAPVAGIDYVWDPSAGLSANNIANPVATPSTTTLYTLEATHPTSLCSSTDQVNVTVASAPSASVNASVSEVCSGASANLTFTMTGVGPWDVTYTTNGGSPATLNNITNSSGNVISTGALTADATYQITSVYDDGASCTNPTGGSALVSVNPVPSVSISVAETSGNTPANNGITCSGDQVELTASGSGGTGTITYDWIAGTSGTNPVKTLFPTATTTYTVVITDAESCKDTASQAITVNGYPSITSTPDVVTICNGASTTINTSVTGGSGSNTYLWSPGSATTASINVNPSAHTGYTVVVTDGGGCTATDNSQVNVNSTPSVSVSANVNPICNGSSAVLTATGSGGSLVYTSYTWSHSLGVGSPKTVSPSSPTTYTVTVTDDNNCTGSNTRTVNVNASPSVSISVVENSGPAPANNGTTCSGDNVALSANVSSGTPSYTYSWSNSIPATAGPHTVSPTSNTTYYVTVTDNNSCTTTGSRVITTLAKPAVVIDVVETSGTTSHDGTICNGYAATTLEAVGSGGAGGFSYVWDNSLAATAGPHTIAPTANTTYNTTVTDANLCTGTISRLITVNALPGAPAWNQTYAAACTGSTAVPYSVTGAGGTYNWSFSNGCITCTGCAGTDSGVLDFSTCGTGSYTISVTETNANSCTSTALTQAVTITTGSPPAFSAQPSNATECTNGDPTFSVTASDATSYQWQVCTTCPATPNWANIAAAGSGPAYSNYSCAACSTLTLTDVVSGNSGYQYRSVVSGACPPTATSNAATLTVNEAPSISAHPSTQSKCTSENVTFSVTASGTPTPTYQWRKGGSNISGATSSSYTITGVVSGDAGSFDVVVTNTCGNVTSNAATLTINVSSTNPTSVTVKSTYCIGASGSKSTVLTVNGGSLGSAAKWQWYKGATCCGTAVATGDTTSDSGTATITLSSSAPDAIYHVRAEGSCNTTSSVATSAALRNTTVSSAAVTHNDAYWDLRAHRTVNALEIRTGACSSGTDYTFNSNNVYINSTTILVPDISNSTVSSSSFRGYPSSGYVAPSSTSFQFDNTDTIDSTTLSSTYNATKLFVSGIIGGGTGTTMTYCKALYNANGNTAATCPLTSPGTNCITIDGPDSTLLYPSISSPLNGIYVPSGASGSCSGASGSPYHELYDAGALKNCAANTFNELVSQQQLAPEASADESACVDAYGNGWRIPTDMEVGHGTDCNLTAQGFNTLGYKGSAINIWTSTAAYNVSGSGVDARRRWTVNISTGSWGFINISSTSIYRVRCVYDPAYTGN